MTGRQRVLVAMLCGAALVGGAAWAESPARVDAPTEVKQIDAADVVALVEAARLRPLIQIVATEGARHGMGLEDALFPGRGGEAWARAVARIQSPERMGELLSATLDRELGDPEMRAAVSFYATDLGAKVANREVASRRAMLDAEIEAGAMQASATLVETGDRRIGLVRELIDTLDLVTSNVTGGLNANFAFYRGLGDGGALKSRMTESEMLAMVWGQEGQVRAATARWLDAYLMLAYTPLSDDELRSYIDWAGSPDGRRLSAALFTAFGRVFEQTSYELGLAAARFMQMEDA